MTQPQSRLLRRMIDPVRSTRVGEFAHRRLNPDTGETYDHPGPHQIPYDL